MQALRTSASIAVQKLSDGVKNQIICLIGPPGVGKTSIASSVAKALGREYVRVSLGGIRDEADVRGHRKTYVGAMPGRIVDALIHAKSENPLIVLDEIDKLANDSRGDPASALLEVLDPEQNKFFRDHYLEFPLDLSDCVFLATANNYQGVPEPLLDRMEIIELGTYSKREKIDIATHHLIPKQIKRHGLNKRQIHITDDGLIAVIDGYTREAGVRNLEREIASLCRKVARDIVSGKVKTVKLDADRVAAYLGKRRVPAETIEKTDSVGIVNGLAYTSVGGDLLKVEVAVMEGTGKIELTGSLGDVMKESARIAVSYARTVAEKYVCEGNYIQPTFITDYPIEMSPLCKRHRNNPDLTERFELMVNGKELCNAYSELNDPIDQAERFQEQLRLSEKGDDEAMFIDQDFVRALEYGMPPTSGMGIGMDRLAMLMTGQLAIQEVLFFPQMRPEKKIPKDPASAFTAIGIPEEWVPVLQKAGYNLVSDLKDGNAQKIQQEIGGINKKYKLGYTTPSVNDVTEWIEKLA